MIFKIRRGEIIKSAIGIGIFATIANFAGLGKNGWFNLLIGLVCLYMLFIGITQRYIVNKDAIVIITLTKRREIRMADIKTIKEKNVYRRGMDGKKYYLIYKDGKIRLNRSFTNELNQSIIRYMKETRRIKIERKPGLSFSFNSDESDL